MERLPEGTQADEITLRRWTAGDGEALHAAIVASVEHLRPWMAWIQFEPQTVAEREALIAGWDQSWQDGGDVLLGIWRGGQLVGSCGLHRRIGEGGLEIGYWIHVDHIGQGLATLAAGAATEMAFAAPGIDRVEIHHDVANAASARVPEKLGYTMVGQVAAARPDVAPAETGMDCIWRVTREQ